MSYEVRGAVEIKKQPATPQELDQQQITNLRKYFGWLNKQWIFVSFVHMAIAMLLFSDGTWYTTLAILVMVLGVDLGLMFLSVYIEIQRRFRQPVGAWSWLAFLAALALEFGLNTAALWSHRPSPDRFPDGASKLLSVVFGAFVALIIYVSATVQTKLDRTRLAADEHYTEQARQREQQRQRDDEARRKREEDEDYRRRRREEQDRIMALQRHNEAIKTLAPPDEAALYQRQGNGKADIAANDVPAILAALHAAGVSRIDNAAKLREVCGWSSYSTATKARDILLEAGALREITGGGFVVVRNGGNS